MPEGSTLDLAMAPQRSEDGDSNPAVGRALYSGRVRSGAWLIAEASPAVSLETLDAALGFVRDLVEEGRLRLRGEEERVVFDANAAIYSPEEGSLVWEGDWVRLAEPDERTLLILAAPVFRMRFGAYWPSDPIDAGDG